MQFSQLINYLEKGNAELQDYHLANNPELVTGASIEKACSDQLSFLEKGSPLKSELGKSHAGAILIPPEKELIKKVNNTDLAWAVFNNPRLAFAESLNLLNPRKKRSKGESWDKKLIQ